MRVCIVKATGRVVEMQTDAAEGTLIKNALSMKGDDGKALYKKADVEEREVTPQQYAELMAAQPETADERQERIRREIRALETTQPRALREAALGMGTDRLQEIENAIAALRAELSA